MLWVAAVVLIMIGIVLIALFIPLTVQVQFGNGLEAFQGTVSIRWLFGLVHAKRELKDIRPTITDEGPSLNAKVEGSKQGAQKRVLTAQELGKFVRDFQTWRHAAGQVWPVIRRFCSHLHIEQFQTKLRFGTGDPPLTGMLYGAAWSGFAAITGFACELCVVETQPMIEIEPLFERRAFDLQQSCIFTITLGHAISAGLRIYRIWSKTVRRRRRGTSDFRSHADRNEQHS